MLYADLRGHHGKRWNYEPGDWYMGRKNKHKQETNMMYGKKKDKKKKKKKMKKNKKKK